MRTRLFPLLAFVPLILAGCGGGGGSTEAPAPAPPGWGHRDASYGVAGVATGVDLAGDVAVGRFAFARDGSTYVLPNNYVVKLDPRGRVVESFGNGGRTDLPSRYTESQSPVIDASGNLFVPIGFGVAKIRPDGGVASEYGAAGVASAIFPTGSPWMYSIATDETGSLYAAGSEYVAKFDPQGRLSNAYAAGGQHYLELGSGSVSDVQVDRLGNTYLGASTSAQGVVVIKLNATGTLAGDFGVNGVWSGACRRGLARSIAILPSGGLAVAVYCDPSGSGESFDAFVFKLDEHGNTVTAYRDGGLRRGVFGAPLAYPTKILALPGDEVLVAGVRGKVDGFPGCATAAVARLDARGEPVPPAGGGAALFLESDYPTDLGMDAAGWLYIGTMRRNSCASHPPAGSVAAIYKLSPN